MMMMMMFGITLLYRASTTAGWWSWVSQKLQLTWFDTDFACTTATSSSVTMTMCCRKSIKSSRSMCSTRSAFSWCDKDWKTWRSELPMTLTRNYRIRCRLGLIIFWMNPARVGSGHSMGRVELGRVIIIVITNFSCACYTKNAGALQGRIRKQLKL